MPTNPRPLPPVVRAPEETPDERTAAGGEPPIDRRVAGTRESLLARVADEYRDMPGLKLTAAQASRLFGLREDICVRVLGRLIQDGVLERTANQWHVSRSFRVGP